MTRQAGQADRPLSPCLGSDSSNACRDCTTFAIKAYKLWRHVTPEHRRKVYQVKMKTARYEDSEDSRDERLSHVKMLKKLTCRRRR